MTKGISVLIIFIGTWVVVYQAGVRAGREYAIRRAIEEGVLETKHESGEITHCPVSGSR